jgi:predicted MFS family arabinose efflux permease
MTMNAVRDPSTPTNRRLIVGALGLFQILAWGSTYYLLAVLATPIAADTGWSLTWIVGAMSIGMLASGLISPRIGRTIDRFGGRPVLAASAVLFAAGLALLAVSPHLIVFIAGWIVIGFGMATGLYDAVFSTLGRLYGDAARGPITAITLFGGLASTTCWPLTAYMAETLGWRGACLIYAGIHLTLACPTYLLLLPRETPHEPHTAHANGSPATPVAPMAFVLLAVNLALTAVITSVTSVHLLTILQARDLALAAAVALGALVGPAQVTARIVEMVIGRYHHPIWTLAASAAFIAVGIAVLWSGAPAIAAALMIYGAGIGIHSIARGTVPLALFGAQGYATLMGRLARPTLIAGAAAPTAGAVVLEYWGADATLATLAALTAVNLAVVATLIATTPRERPL